MRRLLRVVELRTPAEVDTFLNTLCPASSRPSTR